MKHCTDIAERFQLHTCCECCGECHDTSGAGLTETLRQGDKQILVCDVVYEGVTDEGAYCSTHAEWYPPGLQCLSCEQDPPDEGDALAEGAYVRCCN